MDYETLKCRHAGLGEAKWDEMSVTPVPNEKEKNKMDATKLETHVALIDGGIAFKSEWKISCIGFTAGVY